MNKAELFFKGSSDLNQSLVFVFVFALHMCRL
jgi:hypothetical protein